MQTFVKVDHDGVDAMRLLLTVMQHEPATQLESAVQAAETVSYDDV